MNTIQAVSPSANFPLPRAISFPFNALMTYTKADGSIIFNLKNPKNGKLQYIV